MKLLLMHPPLLDVTFNEIQPTPGQLFTIFSYLRRHNRDLEIDVMDLTRSASQFTGKKNVLFSDFIKKQFEKSAPDVLAISCYTSMHYIITQFIAGLFKEENPKGIVIVGGYHPTVLPADFTTPGAPYDYVVRGEGEIALSRLLKQPLNPQHRAKLIRGIDLDIETEELMWDEYPLLKKNGGKIVIFLGRGCPFRCNFCLEPCRKPGHKSNYRLYSSKKARQTVETLVKKIDPAEMFFGDPIFGLRVEWRRQFLKDLSAVAPDIPIWAETRADTLGKEDVDLLKPLLFRIDLGLDAIVPGNIIRQNKSRNPKKYIARFRTVSDYMNEKEIPHSAFILYNFPGETPESYRRTRQTILDIAKSRPVNYTCFVGQAYCLYPGTGSYLRMKDYEERYGSRFPNDGWWRRISDDRYSLASATIASREMEGEEIDFPGDVSRLFSETIHDKALLHWPHEER